MAQACTNCGSENDDDLAACFTCGQQILQSVRLGQIIASRYEILSRLGRGGMGSVYRAHDRVLEEDVALKVLREDATQHDAARRFRTEIKLARKVVHRNVCRIFEYGEEQGRRFISMELVEGTDLKAAIAQAGRLPPDRAFSIAIQIADGLEAIHHVGVIHRDLKTSNVMLDAAATVRLMDFGIAKHVAQDAAGLTATGHIVGTPTYMSPEQARGEKLDFRSDLYSLGIVVFELFTGRVPFEAETPVAVILKHIHEPPPLEGPRAEGLTPAVAALLARALAKSREERFQTAGEMAHALRTAAGPLAAAPLAASAASGPFGGPTGPTLKLSPAADRAMAASTEVQEPTRDMSTQLQPAEPGSKPVASAERRAPTRTVVLPDRTRGGRLGVTPAVAVAGGVLLVIAAAIVVRPWRGASGPSTAESAVPAAATAVVPAATTATAPVVRSPVTLNALPWARIRLRARGEADAAAAGGQELVTPCVVELAEGTYTVEMENGGITPALTREIQVTTGARNEFVFTMPSFDPASAARTAVERLP